MANAYKEDHQCEVIKILHPFTHHKFARHMTGADKQSLQRVKKSMIQMEDCVEEIMGKNVFD